MYTCNDIDYNIESISKPLEGIRKNIDYTSDSIKETFLGY